MCKDYGLPNYPDYPNYPDGSRAQVCKDYGLPGNSVVFAASVRFAERQIAVLDRLLDALPDSQVSAVVSSSESILSASECL